VISKDNLLREFQDVWADPAAQHGEVFDERARRVVRQFLPSSRNAVVSVLQGWLSEGRNPTGILAARLAAEFRLTELVPDIEELDKRIGAREVLLPYYREWTEKALASLRADPDPSQ